MNHFRDYAIKLWLEEIKYDVKFDSWKKDDVANTEARNEKKDETTPIAYDNDDANDWLCRQIQNAVDKIYGELAWCTRELAPMVSNEIEEETPKEWAIHMRFSDDWRGSMRAMRSYAHKYVVNYVLFQWYRAAGVPGLESYGMEADNALNDLYNEARNEAPRFTPWML